MVSNSSCTPTFRAPILSTGILPHDGRNIRFREVTETIRAYNFAPSFCYFAANNIAGILDRDYNTDTFDLSDIDVHNGIEHDASLTRKLPCHHSAILHELMVSHSSGEDSYFSQDQGKPAVPRIEKLLASGTGPNGDLTPADLSRELGKARVESKRNNPQYSQQTRHKLFGSSKYVLVIYSASRTKIDATIARPI